jgi:DNA-binding XRE family transcriptional regulator
MSNDDDTPRPEVVPADFMVRHPRVSYRRLKGEAALRAFHAEHYLAIVRGAWLEHEPGCADPRWQESTFEPGATDVVVAHYREPRCACDVKIIAYYMHPWPEEAFPWPPATLWRCPRCSTTILTRDAVLRCPRCRFVEGRLATVIRKLRAAERLTQEQLAKKAGVTQGYIAQLESGLKKNPSLPTLKKLPRALDVPVGRLLE